MKLLKNSFLIVLLALAFSACKNDIKLNAPYKEIPTIYAVLNPNEAVQMIRVNKVFLSETDANEVAKIADSVNYKPNEITGSLNHSNKPGVITFSESVVTTQDGAFSTTQRVYVSDVKLETYGIYTLTVKNNNTGNVFTSTTTAIDHISPAQTSNLFSTPFYPFPANTSPNLYIDYSKLIQKYNVRFNPNDPLVYKITMRFHFHDSLFSGVNVDRYADFTSSNIQRKGYAEILFSFTGEEVLSGLGVALSKLKLDNDIYGRRMDRIEYIFNSTTQDYVDYLQYAAPSLSINQNKPLYSNFKEKKALGIFTFRTTFSLSKNLSSFYLNTIATNPNTCYKFYKSDLVVGCF